MRGKHRIVIKNNRLHYEFEIKRNITIIQGNSATGKTTLINMLRQAENLGASSGIDVVCDVPCRLLEGRNWKLILENSSGNIFFADEENAFINTEEFAAAVSGSDNYFVLITRENLYNLPYSVEEIYGLHSSGKYHDTRQVYQQTYRIYSNEQSIPVNPEKIIAEDSNSGYEFFGAVSGERGISCVSAGGKEIRKILENPEDYIDSKVFFSWERYFAKLLTDMTEGTYFKYKKAKLNGAYLHEKNKEIILKSIKGIRFLICS